MTTGEQTGFSYRSLLVQEELVLHEEEDMKYKIRAHKRGMLQSHGQSGKTFWKKCHGNWGQMISRNLPKKAYCWWLGHDSK